MIDWNFIMISFNKIKGTNYHHVEDMLRHVHRTTGSLRAMEAVMGVSWATIATQMDHYGISRRKQPRKGVYPAKIAAIPAEELLGMTSRDVAERVGCSMDWAIRSLGRQGRAYKRRFK